MYKIVPVDQIPSDIKNVSLDNPIEVYKVCLDMVELCKKSNGVGLAAAQIGIASHIFVINRGNSYEYYVNCKYEGIGDKQPSIEGCLSLLDEQGEFRRFVVDRYREIKLTGYRLLDSPTLKFEAVSQIETGMTAIIFQHEIDHGLGLDGLISKIGKEIVIF